MILKAIANGVTEERIAEAWTLTSRQYEKSADLLDGICKEARKCLRISVSLPTGSLYLQKDEASSPDLFC